MRTVRILAMALLAAAPAAAQDWAKAKLDKSPRHQEWVKVKSGDRTVDAFLVTSDAAREAIGKLAPDQVTADLNAAVEHVKALPAASGKVAVGGFCWGGGQTFRFATNRKDIKAGFVFYGTGPQDREALGRIAAPIHGFYGGADERVNATIPTTQEAMKALGKTHDQVIYEGAGHGFMRAGEEPEASEANKKAREQAWVRWKDLLKKI